MKPIENMMLYILYLKYFILTYINTFYDVSEFDKKSIATLIFLSDNFIYFI